MFENILQIHVHTGGYESLYEFIPKSVLPSDYGGEESSINELQGKNKNDI